MVKGNQPRADSFWIKMFGLNEGDVIRFKNGKVDWEIWMVLGDEKIALRREKRKYCDGELKPIPSCFAYRLVSLKNIKQFKIVKKAEEIDNV